MEFRTCLSQQVKYTSIHDIIKINLHKYQKYQNQIQNHKWMDKIDSLKQILKKLKKKMWTEK